MKKCLIIGGGAAGMMAAVAASSPFAVLPGKTDFAINDVLKGEREKPLKVEILEKNEKLGKKLFITGKGRCNLTNNCEPDVFFEHIISNPKFLYSAYHSLDSLAVMDFFERNGCYLKTERANRVFPASDHSSDIIKTLSRMIEKEKIKVRYRTKVDSLLVSNNKIDGVILGDGSKITADYVILACGGCSYPLTGSSGDGYRMAQESGHQITSLKPALVPLITKEEWNRSLQGLSLKNVSVRLCVDQKTVYEGFGEMIFTHYGVSGPLILSASSCYVKKYYGKQALLFIDLKPTLTQEQLDKRILREFEANKNKAFKNALGGLFPAKLFPVMISLSEIKPDKPVHEITKEERRHFVEQIKCLMLTVSGVRDFDEAIITQGGVSIKDINPSTMESKKVKGLFFAGEMMDVDALTGGFNLQIAWSSGYLAGLSVYKNAVKEELGGVYEF